MEQMKEALFDGEIEVVVNAKGPCLQDSTPPHVHIEVSWSQWDDIVASVERMRARV